MTGIFFAVVGKSGVGKDTVLERAKLILEKSGKYYFPRRIITRSIVSSCEKHVFITTPDFMQLMKEGEFCLCWQAHGLHYGLPRAINDQLKSGVSVLANISREVVKEASAIFEKTQIIEITAESETIRKRLVDRGRESVQEVQVRHAREVNPYWHGPQNVSKNSNNGSAANATQRFVEQVLRLSGKTCEQP